MLIVLSDVHMTDMETGSPVLDTELVGFVREVGSLDPNDENVTLLLLGDIIDFLRSEQWELLWKSHCGVAPWSNLGPNFSGFQGSLQEQQLLAVTGGVEGRYPGFAAALKDLKKMRKTRILYVIGNHDYMLQLSPAVRARVVKFLSLDQDPQIVFPVEHLDPQLSVFAEHGNRYDLVNRHQPQAGLWAIGDAIVLRVVNRFGTLARETLGLTDATPLGFAVHEIDNVEPHIHIPLYIAWLAKSKLVSSTDRKKLVDCWRATVSDFMALEQFRETRYGKVAAAVSWLRRLYGLFDLDQLLQHLEKLPTGIGENYAQRAYLVKANAQTRVFGHTHKLGVHALHEADGRRRFYVNTGAWRRVVSRVAAGDGRLDFAGHRVSAFLVVRAPGEFSLFSRCRNP